jgi:hypothetical protein
VRQEVAVRQKLLAFIHLIVRTSGVEGAHIQPFEGH